MPKAIRESEDMQEALADLFKAKDAKGLQAALQKIQAALKKSKLDAKDFGKVLKEVNPKRFKELQENANKTSRALKELEEKQNAVNRAIKNFEPKHTASGIETITKTAAGLG
jgi:tape measure domain-containing protein